MENLERLGGEERGARSSIRRVAISSFVGTALEGYDFLLYATAAALVFNQLFFPLEDPLIGILLAFSTFAVGFFARPVGGILAGHYGDKIGRKPMLVITLTVMGLATVLIGFLPTYAQVGVWAPIFLTTLRLIQGLAVGGEWGGAVLMVVEYSPRNRRGFWGSFPQAAGPLALVLAIGVLSASQAISGDQFLVWGWRIPFILSILPTAVGLYIRARIAETPIFREVRESQARAQLPILEAIRSYPKQILLAAGSFILVSGGYYVIAVFMLSYGTIVLELQGSVMLNGVMIGSAAQIVSCVAFAALSDRIGRRPVILAGAAFMILYSFPLFWMINTENAQVIWLALSLGLIAFGALYGPIAAFFAELFRARVRYSAASLGSQIGQVLGGGLSPLIATALLASFAGAYWPVATFLVVLSVIGLVCVLILGETYQTDMTEARL